MSQTEGPEPEVGGGVGDAAQTVLDGVDGLVHDDLSKVKLKPPGKGLIKGKKECSSEDTQI